MSDFEAQTEQTEIPDARAEKVLSAVAEHLRAAGLSRFSSSVAMGYMKSRLEQENGSEKFKHVMSYFIKQLNKSNKSNKRVAGGESEEIDWQRGCPNRFYTLTANPFWDTASFGWIKKLEESYSVILEEFYKLRDVEEPAFQPYRSPPSQTNVNDTDELGQLATSKGNWNVSYLYLHGVDFQENVERCPNTIATIKEVLPRHYHHAFFSALSPNTHITPHFGPTNKKLRIHLPLVVEGDGAWLRVADKRVDLKQGKAILFDDSFEHEAGNDNPSSPRVVLVVDIWHPDLTDEEIKFLSFVNKGQINAAKKMKELVSQENDSEASGVSIGNDDQDFLSIIENAKNKTSNAPGLNQDQIWKYDVRDD